MKAVETIKIEWKTCLRVSVCAFALYLAIRYWGALAGFVGTLIGAASPLIIGCAVAYVLNILMSAYERHFFPSKRNGVIVRLRTPVCLVLAILTLCGITALIIGLVIPELISCIKFLISEIPPAIDKLLNSDLVERYIPADMLKRLSEIDWREHIANIAQVLASGIGGAADVILTAITSVFSAVVQGLISIIFAVYLLLDKKRLARQGGRIIGTYFSGAWIEKARYCVGVVNDSFKRYIVGQCTEAVILGVLCTLGMLVFRFPYAAMIGALIGFTALIPIAGAYIGAAVGAVMIMTDSPLRAVLFIIFIIVLQQIEGNLIYPKVVGRSIGLPSIWVLAAVTVGGSIMGIAGMLLGVPITASLYRLLRDDVRRRSAVDETATEKE